MPLAEERADGAASSASSSTSQVDEPLPQHRRVTEDAREMRPQRLDVDQRFVDVEDDGRGGSGVMSASLLPPAAVNV
jgi:hypothetical protein